MRGELERLTEKGILSSSLVIRRHSATGTGENHEKLLQSGLETGALRWILGR
jgi:hypothetical protein